MKPKIITLKTACELLGYKDIRSVKRLIDDGILEACRVGNDRTGPRRVVLESLNRYIDDQISKFQVENGIAEYSTLEE